MRIATLAERAAMRAIKDADAVLVSDYGSGLVTPRFVGELASRVRDRRPQCADPDRLALRA